MPTRRAAWLIAPLVLTLGACSAEVHVSGPGATSSSMTSTSRTPSTQSESTSSPSTGQLPTAGQIIDQVKANFEKATSGHVVAEHTSKGQRETIEIAGTLDGKNQSATFTTQKEGAVAEFRVVDARVYVKGNTAYYRKSGASESRAKQLADRWVSIPVASVRNYTDITIGGIIDDLSHNLDVEAAGDLQVSAGSENGQPVWKLTDIDTTLIVQGDGSGRLLRADHTNTNGDQESYRFDEWDAAPTVDAPSNPITT